MGRQVYYYQNNQVALSSEQVAQIAYQAGFRGQDLVTAVAIAKRESGNRPNVHGSDQPQARYSGDRGLFQINSVHDANLIRAGLIQRSTDLFDPLTNARVAFSFYNSQRQSFSPAWNVAAGGWTASGSPTYGTSNSAAQTAVTNAANQGLFGRSFTPVPGSPRAGDGAGRNDRITPLVPNRVRPPGMSDADWGRLLIEQEREGGGNWLTNPLFPSGDFVGETFGAIKSTGDAIAWLFDPDNVVRVLQVAAGGALILIGLVSLLKDTSIGKVAKDGAMLVATRGASAVAPKATPAATPAATPVAA